MSKEAVRNLNVKTPGVSTPGGDAPNAADEAADQAAVEAMANDTSDVEIPAVVDKAPPDLKAYIDEQIAKGIAAGIKTIKKAQSNPAAPAVELPDQTEVDPKKIKTPVLSKQGYVVPHAYGRAPENIVAQIQLGQAR